MKPVLAIAIGALLISNSPLPDGALYPMTGEWAVDLRLSLDDPAYSQPMTLEIAEDNSVAGTFYGAQIEAGRVGSAQGRDCIAFRTSDGSGVYQHSACLVGAVLVGQSWSEGRGFVLPWTATKTISGG